MLTHHAAFACEPDADGNSDGSGVHFCCESRRIQPVFNKRRDHLSSIPADPCDLLFVCFLRPSGQRRHHRRRTDADRLAYRLWTHRLPRGSIASERICGGRCRQGNRTIDYNYLYIVSVCQPAICVV